MALKKLSKRTALVVPYLINTGILFRLSFLLSKRTPRGYISDGDSQFRVVFGNNAAKTILNSINQLNYSIIEISFKDPVNDLAIIQVVDYLLNKIENKPP